MLVCIYFFFFRHHYSLRSTFLGSYVTPVLSDCCWAVVVANMLDYELMVHRKMYPHFDQEGGNKKVSSQYIADHFNMYGLWVDWRGDYYADPMAVIRFVISRGLCFEDVYPFVGHRDINRPIPIGVYLINLLSFIFLLINLISFIFN